MHHASIIHWENVLSLRHFMRHFYVTHVVCEPHLRKRREKKKECAKLIKRATFMHHKNKCTARRHIRWGPNANNKTNHRYLFPFLPFSVLLRPPQKESSSYTLGYEYIPFLVANPYSIRGLVFGVNHSSVLKLLSLLFSKMSQSNESFHYSWRMLPLP